MIIRQLPHRARPRLIIGAILKLALVMPLAAAPVAAQSAAAGYDDSRPSVAPGSAKVAPDSLERSAETSSVALATRPRSALIARELTDLQFVRGSAVEEIAYASDSAASGKGRHILLGMVIGTAAGGGVGYLAGKAWCDSHDDHAEGPPCEIGLPPLVYLSAFVGLIAGGIIGAHAERKLGGSPLHRVAIDAVPLGTRGMTLAVTLQ